MELRESESWTRKPWCGHSESAAERAGRMPITWKRGLRWSPVTLVVEFMDWRSLRRMPGVRVAMAVDLGVGEGMKLNVLDCTFKRAEKGWDSRDRYRIRISNSEINFLFWIKLKMRNYQKCY